MSLGIDIIIPFTARDLPIPLPVRKVGNCILFTIEPFINGNTQREYDFFRTLVDIEAAFGTASKTYQDAQFIFNQDFNFKDSGSVLFIAPLKEAANAIASFILTQNLTPPIPPEEEEEENAEITTILEKIQDVSDGALTIVIDKTASNIGITLRLANLDFTKCVDWVDVANIIQRELSNYIQINVLTSTEGETQLQFLNLSLGLNSTIAFEASTSGTDIAGTDYLNLLSLTSTGVNATGESLFQGITRIDELTPRPEYSHIFTNLQMERDRVLDVAPLVQADFWKYFWYGYSSESELLPEGLISKIRDLKYTKTDPVWGKDMDTALLASLAEGNIYASINPNIQNAAITASSKQVTGLDAGDISDSKYAKHIMAQSDVFCKIGGYNMFRIGKKPDPLFEIAKMLIAIYIQTRIFNYTITVKIIGNNEEDLIVVDSYITEALLLFVRNGIIQKGVKWRGETYGDSQIWIENIRNNGFAIYREPTQETQEQPQWIIGVVIKGALYVFPINAVFQTTGGATL